MKEWENLANSYRQVILDLWHNGPDCAKFLSRRIGMDMAECMTILSELENMGWTERVKGTFLFKRGFRRPKHMNHTYYSITKQTEKMLRILARKGLI